MAASAQAASVADDTAADFSQGTRTGAVVRTLLDPDGAVELARTLEEQFDTLPPAWTSTPWPLGGHATVSSGALLVDGTRIDSVVPAGPGSSIEFKATLGAQTFAHVGFATDFDTQPWAMFSTSPAGGGKVYARTSDGSGPLADIDFEIPGAIALATQPHLYRIDWTATGFEYYVDGVSVATHAIPLTAPMTAQASDYSPDGFGVSIDSMAREHKASGEFVSRIHDAGPKLVTWGALTATRDLPAGAGAGVAYATRTAAVLAELGAASWAPVSADGTVASPAARYLQYRAMLTTTAPRATPRLDKIELGFTIDSQAPDLTIGAVAVSGTSATAPFGSDDASATYDCKLDAAAFAACTSPKVFSDLDQGARTITVKATDTHGNTSTASKTFTVDTIAPTVTIGEVAVSDTSATAAFSSDDDSATYECKLDAAAFAACASPKAFSNLDRGAHTITVKATDTHGNTDNASKPFTVAAASSAGPTPTSTTPDPVPPSTPPSTTDVIAPKAQIVSRSVRVSKSGVGKVQVKCPLSEVGCTVTVKLKLAGRTVARNTRTVSGGSTRTLDLRLSRAARSALAARSHVSVNAVVSATDAAGNHRTTNVRMTLRAA